MAGAAMREGVGDVVPGGTEAGSLAAAGERRPLNLLIVQPVVRSYGSGQQMMFARLAQGLAGLGNRVAITGEYSKVPQLYSSLVSGGVRVLDFDLKEKGPGSLARLRGSLRSERYDAVLSSHRSGDLRLLLVSRGVDARLVSVMQELPSSWLHLALLGLTFDRVVCISEFVRAEVARRAPWMDQKLATIPNGVDCSSFSPCQVGPAERRALFGVAAEGRLIVALTGRLSPEKEPARLLDLAEMLRTRDAGVASRVRLAYIGDGVMRRELGELCRRRRLGRQVVFAGSLSDVPLALNCADVVVHFCRVEGFGLGLAEAMACERPVVAMSGSGVDELIERGRTGFLVDSLAEMAQRVTQLAGDENLRRRLGADARRSVAERFSLQLQVCRYARLLRSMTG